MMDKVAYITITSPHLKKRDGQWVASYLGESAIGLTPILAQEGVEKKVRGAFGHCIYEVNGVKS